jgi:hypothetical protein
MEIVEARLIPDSRRTNERIYFRSGTVETSDRPTHGSDEDGPRLRSNDKSAVFHPSRLPTLPYLDASIGRGGKWEEVVAAVQSPAVSSSHVDVRCSVLAKSLSIESGADRSKRAGKSSEGLCVGEQNSKRSTFLSFFPFSLSPTGLPSPLFSPFYRSKPSTPLPRPSRWLLVPVPLL